MKKHRYWILELSMLLLYGLFQFVFILLRKVQQVKYTNGYLLFYFTVFSVVFLSALFWFSVKFSRAGVPLWLAGVTALVWVLVSLVLEQPYLLFLMRLDLASSELIGWTWVVAVWHVFEFFHLIQNKKGVFKRKGDFV